MPPKQLKHPSQPQKTGHSIPGSGNATAVEHVAGKKDRKLKSPPTHLPKIGSPVNDSHLTRLPSPLDSPDTSIDISVAQCSPRQEENLDLPRLKTPVECSESDLQSIDDCAIDTASPRQTSILNDMSPRCHASPQPTSLSSSFIGRRYKQSIEKYKNSKANPTAVSSQLTGLPPTHPDHRDPKDYLERLRTPSPVLPTPSPLSRTATQDTTPAISHRDRFEERLLTPMESPTSTSTATPQKAHIQQPKGNKKVRPNLLQRNTPAEDPILERLSTPNLRSHNKARMSAEEFYFPDFDEDSSDNPVTVDISFISRLETPNGMPLSRPFSRLNSNVPFYVPDADNFPETGITDIVDYNSNLISLNDLPQDYSAIIPAPPRPADVSCSAPSSMTHDPLERNECTIDKAKPVSNPIRSNNALLVDNLSNKLNEEHGVAESNRTIEDDMEKITVNTNDQDISSLRSDIAAFSETFDLLVPAPQQANQSIYKHVRLDLLSENVCRICRYPFYKPVTLNCSHTFCAECMYHSLLLWESRCPICKASVSHLPHVNVDISERVTTQVESQMSLSVGNIVRVLVPGGKVTTYSCGIITSIQNGFSFEGPDGIQVRSAQTLSKMTKQVQQHNNCSGTPCKIATVQCGSSLWLGRLCDLLFVDPRLLSLGTRLNSGSLCIFSSDAISLITASSIKPSLNTLEDGSGDQITSVDAPINYIEPRFLRTFRYTIDNLSEQIPIHMLLEEVFGSDTTTFLSPTLERVEGPSPSFMLRLCTDLSDWLLMPAICCVNCKMIAQLPVRLKCGCLSCMVCAFDCHYHGWPCFGCGESILFLDLCFSELRVDTQTSIKYSLPLKNSIPLGTLPMDTKILNAISDTKASTPYLSKYLPVHVLQESLTDSSFGFLLTEPNEKLAKVMLKSGTILTVDINRIKPLPLESLRLALRVQTPLVAMFNTKRGSSASVQLPLLGLTDLATPRQFVTRFGKHKSTTTADRSIMSLSVFTMVYNIDSFIQQMCTLVDEISAHNKEVRRSNLYTKYRDEYIAHTDHPSTKHKEKEEHLPDALIPTTTLQDAMTQSQNEYFNEQFNDLIRLQEKIEQDLRPFGLLECSRFSNYVKLISSFAVSEFICTACTRIAVWPVRLSCGHLTCRTCAAIYCVSQIPCLLCGHLMKSIEDVKPDVRTFQKICSHIPGKLHAEQIDCGTYVYKPANRNIGVGIVLNTMSRGGILFATVGFVRSIGTFRLAELAVLLPAMELSKFDEKRGRDTPAPIESPNDAIGQACIVVADGPYKNIFGLIVRKNGSKAKVILTVVLEVGLVVQFTPADLRTIKLIGPLCNYSKLRMYAQLAEKSFIAQERYAFSVKVEASVREELEIATDLCLAGKAPQPPRTVYSYLPQMSVVNTKRLLSRAG